MYSDFRGLHHMYMMKKVTPRLKRPQLRRTFIRQWREHRGLTLETLAERVGEHLPAGFTHASLSRIERGLQPYSQAVLEAIAEELQTDAASLLMRDPSNDQAMWSLWDQAKPGERQMIESIVQSVLKTGAKR